MPMRWPGGPRRLVIIKKIKSQQIGQFGVPFLAVGKLGLHFVTKRPNDRGRSASYPAANSAGGGRRASGEAGAGNAFRGGRLPGGYC